MQLNNYFVPEFSSPAQPVRVNTIFSVHDIAEIQRLLSNIEYTKALVDLDENTPGENKEVRRSKIKWIDISPETDWLYERITSIMKQNNQIYWRFNLRDMPMSIQYTEYHATDEGRYDWHMDMGHGETSCRKLSTSILLSNTSDFEGGKFQFFKGGKAGEEIFEYPLNNPGDMVIFPSYMIHRVTPVTKGIRRSLVLWVGGEPFK